MKLIEIPENTNELRDYNKFINTIVEVRKFNNNVDAFLTQVLKDEFFKTYKEWMDISSEKDQEQLKALYNWKNEIKDYKWLSKEEKEEWKWKFEDSMMNDKLFYCYETNTFIKVESNYRISSHCFKKCKPTDNGLGMYIYFRNSYKEHAWPTWLPTFHVEVIYQIDLLTKSVKKISDYQTETSNRRY